MFAPGVCPRWEANLIDYPYMSFTDATAFSPTPAVPRSRPARLLMVVQQLASLVAGALVVARAVAVLA